MNSRFFIYFDVKANKEIIKYRKLNKEYILDTNNPDLLKEFDIDEKEDPYHIIREDLTQEIKGYTPAYEAIFINTFNELYDYEIRIQSIGKLLIDFLNINLDNSSDLKDFALKYGLDTLLYMDKQNLLNSCITYTVPEFEELFTRFFESVKNTVSKLQIEFKEALDFCFFDSGNADINGLNPKQRYFLSFHGCNDKLYYTKIPKFEKYSKGISVDYDSFFNTKINLKEFSKEQLIYAVASKDFTFAPSSYSCPKLENALFISFINLLETKNLHINKCANCGRLFIPSSKSNEKYCNYPLKNNLSRTCKDVGADKKYKDKLKEDEVSKLISDTSSRLNMRVLRNPDIEEYKIRLNYWQNNYRIQKEKYLKGEITQDELINWINNAGR